MKIISAFILFIFLVACHRPSPEKQTSIEPTDSVTVNNDTTRKNQIETEATVEQDVLKKNLKGKGLLLKNDSGYILKKEGLSFLLSLNLADSADPSWENLKVNDTIGKFYQISPDRFIVCISDMNNAIGQTTHLLLEISTDEHIYKLERFYHGNYPCCWKNYYEGFNKFGAYLCLKLCGTGSGYCSTSIYLFKNLVGQEKQNPILLNYYSFRVDTDQRLSSNYTIRGENIFVKYTLTDREYRNDIPIKKKQKTFSVTYKQNNGKWEANDSINLKNLDI